MSTTNIKTNELEPTYENGLQAGEEAFANGLAYCPAWDSKFDKLLHHNIKDLTAWSKGWCDGWMGANLRAPWWDGDQWVQFDN
jgi:hypothetical protein